MGPEPLNSLVRCSKGLQLRAEGPQGFAGGAGSSKWNPDYYRSRDNPTNAKVFGRIHAEPHTAEPPTREQTADIVGGCLISAFCSSRLTKRCEGTGHLEVL